MKLIDKKENLLAFSIKTNETLANSLRRMVHQIPIITVDEVDILKNDSPLYDETIAHRIGLIPLKMEKSFKGTDVKKLKMSSNKEGMVYSKDLKGDVEVVYEGIPIAPIGEGQSLEIHARTKIGKGEEHSKFSPGLVYYRMISEVTMDKEFKEDFAKAFQNKEIKEHGNSIVVKDDSVRTIVDFCEGLAKKAGKEVEVKDSDEIIFIIESFGQITAEEIFKKVLDLLKKDLVKVSKNLK